MPMRKFLLRILALVFVVSCGGSAASRFDATRVSNRYENLANHFKSTMGFRLAL